MNLFVNCRVQAHLVVFGIRECSLEGLLITGIGLLPTLRLVVTGVGTTKHEHSFARLCIFKDEHLRVAQLLVKGVS